MRAAIFIDGGYLLQHLKSDRSQYSRLANYVLQPIRKRVPVDLLRCYFYYCAPWMSPNPTEDELRRMEAHRAFVDDIENVSRWQVRLGKLEKRWDGNKEYFEQKRVDVLFSVDLVRHAAAGHIQHAVLIAGDSDFIPAVQAAKESGVTVSLWCGPLHTVHRDLVTLVDELHHFDWRDLDKVSEVSQTKDGILKPQRPATNGRHDEEPVRREEARGGDWEEEGESRRGGRRRGGRGRDRGRGRGPDRPIDRDRGDESDSPVRAERSHDDYEDRALPSEDDDYYEEVDEDGIPIHLGDRDDDRREVKGSLGRDEINLRDENRRRRHGRSDRPSYRAEGDRRPPRSGDEYPREGGENDRGPRRRRRRGGRGRRRSTGIPSSP